MTYRHEVHVVSQTFEAIQGVSLNSAVRDPPQVLGHSKCLPSVVCANVEQAAIQTTKLL